MAASSFSEALVAGFSNLGCLWPEDQPGGACLRDIHLEGRVNCDYAERDAAWKRLIAKRAS
jgi:hypothetical protein